MSSPTSPLRTTPLHSVHRSLGATLVDFHGWEMPLRYGTIPEEHLRVRETAGVFDLCHMGRLLFTGAQAENWLQRVLSVDVSRLGTGRAKYALLLNEDGRPIDDAIVYRRESEWLLVVNASNRERVIAWCEAHRPAGEASLEDHTIDTAMIAVQGPTSAALCASVISEPEKPWNEIRYYEITRATYQPKGRGPVPVDVARTGYTGEDGFEVFVPSDEAEGFWNAVLAAGGDRAAPIGLGARDTLRLEAGMPLYGNEIDETTDPLEAGLTFALHLDKPVEFLGKKALLERQARGVARRLRGFRLESRRIPRQGMSILLDGRAVGTVTSGAPSPTLGYPIAMGYLDVDAEEQGADRLELDVRGRGERIQLHALPFYSRKRKKGS